MSRPQTPTAAFLAADNGQDLVEYGLIIGLLALAAITAMHLAANGVTQVFSAVGSTLTSST